ncbi:hypothetical protein MAPG_08933, partial [Magnaporthiopsis poae ATCC 64411]
RRRRREEADGRLQEVWLREPILTPLGQPLCPGFSRGVPSWPEEQPFHSGPRRLRSILIRGDWDDTGGSGRHQNPGFQPRDNGFSRSKCRRRIGDCQIPLPAMVTIE